MPEQVIAGTRQAPVIVYPGLSDMGAHVDLQLFASPAARDLANRAIPTTDAAENR